MKLVWRTIIYRNRLRICWLRRRFFFKFCFFCGVFPVVVCVWVVRVCSSMQTTPINWHLTSKNPASPLWPHRGLLYSNTSASSSNSILKIIKQIHLAAMGTRSATQPATTTVTTTATTASTTNTPSHHRTRSRMDEVLQAAAGSSQQSNSSPTRGKKRKVAHQPPSHPQPPFILRNPHTNVIVYRTAILLSQTPQLPMSPNK